MLETAKTRQRNERSVRCWRLLDGSMVRRVLGQRVMDAILVMVGHVLAEQPAEVLFIESDNMVEDFASATPHPPCGCAILPGRPLWFQTGRL